MDLSHSDELPGVGGYDESTQAPLASGVTLSERASLHSTDRGVTAKHLAAIAHGWQKGSPACLNLGPTVRSIPPAGAESWVLGLAWKGVGAER